MHFFVLCVWLWIRVGPRVKAAHYVVAAGVVLAGSIGILSNVGRVVGVFDRSATLSGRVDLWGFLLNDVIPRRLWWGHGFGAIWFQESFRVVAQQRVGWVAQVVFADNGFLDILLHLGIVGFSIFLGVLITASIRSVRFAMIHRTLTDSFPLLMMLYAWIGNIAFSLFAEREMFVWFLVVVVLFMTTPPARALRDTPARC
jgi:hypothetical protein